MNTQTRTWLWVGVAAASLAAAWLLPPSDANPQVLSGGWGFLVGLIAKGVLLGVVQGMLLRGYANFGGWVLATTVGWLVLFVTQGFAEWAYPAAGAIYFGAGAIVAAFLQWLSFKRRADFTWWIAGTAVGHLVAYIALLVVTDLTRPHAAQMHQTRLILDLAVFALFDGVLVALVTGMVIRQATARHQPQPQVPAMA